ncbi:transporter substrate-binding domain-containing protein [Fundidesulfovibrio butyratiphilus]
MKLSRYIPFLILAAFVAAGALYWEYATQDQSLARVRSTRSLRIGYAVEAPYAFLTADGEVTGQSPELARQVCAALGVERIEWRLAEFGSLLDELENSRVDVIAAGMFITPARAERVAFSEPFFHVRQGLLVAAGNPLRLHDYTKAVSLTGARIAALTGSFEIQLLERLGLPQSRLLHVPDAQTGRAAVESGLADALALSSVTIAWMATRDQLGKTEMADPFEQPNSDLTGAAGYGAFVFRKKDKALLKAWNAAQSPLVRAPEYLALIKRFGFSPGELPGNVSVKDVLAR